MVHSFFSRLRNLSQHRGVSPKYLGNPSLKLVVIKRRVFSARYLRGFTMKNGRFSDAQIVAVSKQAEGGVPVSELCREHGMSSASFYNWRAKFGGMHCTAEYRVEMSRQPSAWCGV